MTALIRVVVAVALLLVAQPARADLIDLGNGLIYDTVQDLTWVQDTMLARTLGQDEDGLFTESGAFAWVASLEYGGFDDWRLPAGLGSYTLLENNSEIALMLHDLGWVIDPCCGVEYSHQGGVGPFLNFFDPPFSMYWLNDGRGRPFHNLLVRDIASQDREIAGAWAVRDGSPYARVPEPSTLWLVAVAGVGFVRMRRWRAFAPSSS